MGPIEVIAGSMFSGKSQELIRRLRMEGFARKKLLIMYPRKDTNSMENEIIIWGRTENGVFLVVDSLRPAYPIETKKEAWKLIVKEKPSVIGMDEAQFFGDDIVELVEEIRDSKTFYIRQIIAGLDRDYAKKPFGPMSALLALSTDTSKLAAVCFECGKSAHYTQRISGTGDRIMVGKEEYEARCIECHYVFRPN